MINNKRYNIDRFSNLDKIYYGNVERPYVIEPAGIEKNKYDLFTDFLASFIYKHEYNSSIKGLNDKAKEWVFNKDFEKLMMVYSAVDLARENNNLKSLGISTYLSHLKINGVEIRISDELQDKLEKGMYEQVKNKDFRMNDSSPEDIKEKKQTLKI